MDIPCIGARGLFDKPRIRLFNKISVA